MKANLFLVFFLGNLIFISEKSFSENNYSSSPSSGFSIAANYKLYPGTNHQVQTSVATNPVNSLIMSASSITDVYPGGYTTGAYVTTNGGLNWSGTNSISTQSGSIITTLGDPNIIIDKNGNHILTYTAPALSGSDYRVGVSCSSNNGLYWSSTVYVPGVGRADKTTSIADNNSGSPFYGKVYIIYSDFIKSGLYISSSTNSGVSWDSVKRISPSFNDARVGSSVAIGKLGEIFVTWPFYLAATQGYYVGFAKSTNGGLNWTSKDTAVSVNSIRSAHKVYINSIRANGLPTLNIDKSGGPRDGNLYITCTEKDTAGSPALDDYDVLIHASTNQGNSWTPARRVNQDPGGSLRYQFYPAFSVDDFGGVNVIYYDTRNTPTNDSFQVYLSRSLDGGFSFEDYLVSDHKFKLKAISPTLFGVPGYIGTYIGVTSSKRSVTPVWFDNANETYQAWSASIGFGADIKFIPEGIYNLTSGKFMLKDTAVIYLRNSFSPYSKIDSAKTVIDSVSFIAKAVFKNANSGNYYLQLSHRNSVSIWSSAPVVYSTGTNLFYDFTLSEYQAFGENMISHNSKWCAYGGDVSKDGNIDMIDANTIFNDMSAFVTGYCDSDVNGDLIVDLNDLNITFNNSANFIQYTCP